MNQDFIEIVLGTFEYRAWPRQLFVRGDYITNCILAVQLNVGCSRLK